MKTTTSVARKYTKEEFFELLSRLFPGERVTGFEIDNTPHGQISAEHPYVVKTEKE